DLVVNLPPKELRLCLLNCPFELLQVVLCAVVSVCLDGCLTVSIPPVVGACRDLYHLGICVEGLPDGRREGLKGFLYVRGVAELASPYIDKRLCDSQREPYGLLRSQGDNSPDDIRDVVKGRYGDL